MFGLERRLTIREGHPRRDVFRNQSRLVTSAHFEARPRHGFYCDIYILISPVDAGILFRCKTESSPRDQRNIYPAIRTCNNSGYFTVRAGSPFMQSDYASPLPV